MTNKAFELLKKKVEKENAKGIFLMVEEGIIDYAGKLFNLTNKLENLIYLLFIEATTMTLLHIYHLL